MRFIAAAVACVLLPVAQAAAQRPTTDTTLTAAADVRIAVQNNAGEVIVRTWNRNAVRISARHSPRDFIKIGATEASIRIGAESRRGMTFSVDYELTVPAGASITINGMYNDATIEGVRGTVRVETLGGNINLRGGDGVVQLKSVQGTVTVEDAKGKIEVRGVNRGLVLRRIEGDVVAETVNGSILMEGIRSANVDAATVNGRIVYEGTIRDNGRYSFGTHNGEVRVSVPEGSNATFSVATYGGHFVPRIPITRPAATGSTEGRRQRRHSFTLGNGTALVEIESFQGNIVLQRPGTPTPVEDDEDNEDK